MFGKPGKHASYSTSLYSTYLRTVSSVPLFKQPIIIMMKYSPGRHKSPRRGTAILLIWNFIQFATNHYDMEPLFSHKAFCPIRHDVPHRAFCNCHSSLQRTTPYLKSEPFIKCQTVTRDPRAKKNLRYLRFFDGTRLSV